MEELVGHASNRCDLAWMRLVIDRGRVASAEGSGEGSRQLCREVRGLTLLDAAAIGGAPLALDALHDAIGPAVRARGDAGRVAVAMSGGVDSAVALLRARQAGYSPVGVTLRLWTDPAGPDTERACCSPAAVVAARAACHAEGLPHVTLDLREPFRAAVVERFVAGYARGQTPNPCSRCNGAFRFRELLAFTRRVGAQKLVTGHYARLAEHRGRVLLAQAADAVKDQSYMLGTLEPRLLERLWFPLGDQTKAVTREEARVAGLEAADRLESQDACFLAGSDYRDFLERRGLTGHGGPIVDEAGNELGRHVGYWRFTPGQRRGLGIATAEPLYAIRMEPKRNAVVVGPRPSLARTTVTVRSGRLFVPVERVEAKLRYRSLPSPATVSPTGRGFRLELDEAAFGVAPGQTAVLYEDGAVVGAGTITTAE